MATHSWGTMRYTSKTVKRPVSFARLIGVGALVAGGITVALWLLTAALFVAPCVFWFAWNVLKFGPAIGLPMLGVWGILLATLFLTGGWFVKVMIAVLVFVIDPGWFGSEALLRWPAPTLRNFSAVVLLALLASRPHARRPVQREVRDDRWD